MIKTAPSPLRLAALIGFVLACVLTLSYLWISFGGSVPLAAQGYRVQVAFPQANELATGADVRIAGVDVGTVVGLRMDGADNRTLATLQINKAFAPIPRDSRATLRIKTLLGETFVELSSGHRSAGPLPDHGRLPDAQVEPDVAIDQILSTFDPKTRKAFQTWMEDQAGAVQGQGENINASFGLLPGFFDTSEKLLSTLHGQSAEVRGLVSHTGQFFNAISAQRGQLSGLITAADSLFSTTAQRNRDLSEVFQALPQFEAQSRLALPALTAFGKHADPTIRRLEPVASQLTTTFRLTQRLAPQFRLLFDRLGTAITASKRGLPAFNSILNRIPKLLQAFQPFLRNADPMVRYIGLFDHEITGFFGNVTGASQGYYSNDNYVKGQAVHYLRASQTLSPLSLAFYPHPIGVNRDSGYRTPGIYNLLKDGLPTLNTGECTNGNPAPPSSATGSIPITPPPGQSAPTVASLIQDYFFRTSGRNVAAQTCKQQGTVPGYSTEFPHLTADPPPGLSRDG